MTTVTVTPTNKNPTHMIKLSYSGTDIGLCPINQAEGIQEIPYTPSSLKVNEGGGKYSDFDLPYSQIAQTDFSGGRGQETYEDTTRFYDSHNMWTMGEGMAVPAPMWNFATGYRSQDVHLWKDVTQNTTWTVGPLGKGRKASKNATWAFLYGDTRRYHAVQFTASATYTPTQLQFFIRRIGAPGTLTAAIFSNDDTTAPHPEAIVGTAATATTTQVTDLVGRWYTFAIAPGQLTSGTKYWVYIYGAATDTLASGNYWAIRCETVTAGATALYSANGTAWTQNSYSVFYACKAAATQATWGLFQHKHGLYAYRNNAGDVAPDLYMCGDRGVADSTSTTAHLDDATKTWVADALIGSTVYIFNGTGYGQYRRISDNDATTVTADPAFMVAPDNTSEYVIWDSALTTSAIGTHGLTKPITDVVDTGAAAYFAMGDKAKMRHMWARQAANALAINYYDNGTSTAVYADKVHCLNDATGTVKLWRALNTSGATQVGNATVPTTASDVLETTSFTSAGYAGPFEIPTNLLDYDNQVWLLTHKNAYFVQNNQLAKLGMGIDAVPSLYNGVGACSQNLFLYFSWSHSLERYYGTTLDDMGPWKDAGLPEDRRGPIVSVIPVVGWLIVAVNAGKPVNDGYSSVLVWNGRGWHEIWRGFTAGTPISQLHWEAAVGQGGRLWIGYGDDLIYMDFPENTLNPLRDLSMVYNNEGNIVTSWHDCGYNELPKYFKEVVLRANDLAATRFIDVDYQVDGAGDSSTWTKAATSTTKVADDIALGLAEKRRIRLRFRFHSETYGTASNLVAYVLKAFARAPVKYQYNIKFRVGHNLRTYNGLPDHDPDTLLNQLESWSEATSPLTMRCVLERMDGKTVIVEPPSVARKTWNKVQSWFTGTASIVLREV